MGTAAACADDSARRAKPVETMLASAYAAALRNAKADAIPAAESPRKAKAPARVRQASKAARFKATRAKLRSKAKGNAKRRTRR